MLRQAGATRDSRRLFEVYEPQPAGVRLIMIESNPFSEGAETVFVHHRLAVAPVKHRPPTNQHAIVIGGGPRAPSSK